MSRKLDLFSEKVEKYAVSVKRQLKEQVFEHWLQKRGQGKVQRKEWRLRYKRLYFNRFLEHAKHKTTVLKKLNKLGRLCEAKQKSAAFKTWVKSRFE